MASTETCALAVSDAAAAADALVPSLFPVALQLLLLVAMQYSLQLLLMPTLTTDFPVQFARCSRWFTARWFDRGRIPHNVIAQDSVVR
jgi:hypothetical protein